MHDVDQCVDQRIIPLMKKRYVDEGEWQEAIDSVKMCVRRIAWNAWRYGRYGGQDPYKARA